jgi:hypothetical protein
MHFWMNLACAGGNRDFKEGSCFDEDKVEERHQRWRACIVASTHTFGNGLLDGGEEKDDIGKDRYLYITDTSRNAFYW